MTKGKTRRDVDASIYTNHRRHFLRQRDEYADTETHHSERSIALYQQPIAHRRSHACTKLTHGLGACDVLVRREVSVTRSCVIFHNLKVYMR